MPKIKMQTEFDVPDDVFEQGIEKAIKNNPDYVLVVRCKDCKHFSETNHSSVCKMHSENPYQGNSRGFEMQMLPSDFCSYGERRTDDDR